MKEILSKILTKLPKSTLVYLVIALGGLVAHTWYKNYNDRQDLLLKEINKQGENQVQILKTVNGVASDVQQVKKDFSFMSMEFDTMLKYQSSYVKNQIGIMKSVNELYKKAEPVKVERPVSDLEMKSHKMIELNNDIISAIEPSLKDSVKKKLSLGD